jgi:LmbE family N-acetylglucosaminyl deacetylase
MPSNPIDPKLEIVTEVPDSAMVIFAHPDDAESGSGGVVARWVAAGCAVTYVLCTNGGAGTADRSLTPAELARKRADEQRAAASSMGVKNVVMLGYPDGGLEDSRAFLGDVVLTTPLLAALAKQDGPLDVVTTPAAAPLLEGHPAVRRVIRYDKRGADAGLAGLWRLGAALRRTGYRRAVLPHRSWRSAALALLATLWRILISSPAKSGLSAQPMPNGSVESIGALLFNKYLLPFELVSFLILAAIIGAVTLAKQEPKR